MSKKRTRQRKPEGGVRSDAAHKFQVLLDDIIRLIQSGQMAEAEASCRRALSLQPNHAVSHYHLGLTLTAQGKSDEALAHFQRALDLNPNLAEAHNSLGSLLGKEGRHDDATAHFEQAVALNPKSAGFRTNLGLAFMQKGKEAEAVEQFRLAFDADPKFAPAVAAMGSFLVNKDRVGEGGAMLQHALALDPKNILALGNFGVALMKAGNIDGAAACFEGVLAHNPDDADVYNNLGTAYEQMGRCEEALAHYDRALALTPNHAAACCNRGLTLASLGRFDEALAEYNRALALNPDLIDAHFNRGRLVAFRSDDQDLAAMEAIAARQDLTPEQANMIQFALATAWEKNGDYRRSFEHLRKGNDLKRTLVPYDEPSVLNSFSHVAESFNRDVFDILAGEGDPSAVPIFVVGMPRSGSTLIEQILASHPQIHGAGELGALNRAADTVIGTRGQAVDEQGLDAEALRQIARAYLALLPSMPEGKTRIVDKLPDNFLRIGLIHAIFPNARIVHTMRDPVDTCVSCYSMRFARSQYFTYNLAELGRYYRSYVELMAHWRSILPPGRILDVVYEDVVDDLEGQARRLIDYCGLPWDDRCLSFHLTKRRVRTASAVQVRQPLFRSSLQRWRKYEAELGPLLDALGDLVPSQDPDLDISSAGAV